VIDLREYQSPSGENPFREWFDSLSSEARQKVSTSLIRMGLGNSSNVKGVGGGIFEYRIDFGPGFRIYFGKDGDRIVILLAGGTKKRQQTDIELATVRWRDYKFRKLLK
jgi:putative addiction module killer protein